jgi:hypothetical protein
MRNFLILGSGRSGTSLLAAMAQRAGYHLGGPLQPPNAGNPLGRFESLEVNAINEALLARVLPRRRPDSLFGKLFLRHVPTENQRWLAAVPLERRITGTPALTRRMEQVVKREPYCLKDPRLSYTLPAWRTVVGDAALVCVFRDPSETAVSMLRECRGEPGLHSLAMDFDRAVRVWTLMYRHILEKHHPRGQWHFIHYKQMLAGDGVMRLSDFLGVGLDNSLVNPALHRSRPAGPVPRQTRQIYDRLCALAEWRDR